MLTNKMINDNFTNSEVKCLNKSEIKRNKPLLLL